MIFAKGIFLTLVCKLEDTISFTLVRNEKYVRWINIFLFKLRQFSLFHCGEMQFVTLFREQFRSCFVL